LKSVPVADGGGVGVARLEKDLNYYSRGVLSNLILELNWGAKKEQAPGP